MIILVGASASGKTEVAKKLIKNYGFVKVVTYTTRKKRENEVNNIDYHFITENKFLKLKEENFFLETTLYNGNYYGTPLNEIDVNKVLIVDPKGLKIFKKLKNPSIVTFYITGSEENRRKRMEQRGDSKEEIEKRIQNDKKDFAYKNIGKTDFVIDGDNKTITEMAQEIYYKYSSKVKF